MNTKRIIVSAAVLLVLSTLLSAQSKKNAVQYPLTVKVFDLNGKEIEQRITAKPERVLTSNVSSTEILLELGLKSRIVGIIKPDNKIKNKYEADFASFYVIGDKKSLSKETVFASRPDIIIGRDRLFNPKTLGTVEELIAAGINAVPQKASVIGIKPVLETVLEDISIYGTIFDAREKAEALVKELSLVLHDTDILVKKKAVKEQKVLAMTNFNGNVFGSFDISKGLQGNVLKRLKLVPALDKPANELSLENLVNMNPDIIFYIAADRNAKNDPTAIEKLRSNPAVSNVGAVRNNKIIVIDYDDFMDYGIRTLRIYADLAQKLYAD